MQFIRQNATHKVVLGPFVDVGDGFTPETGITLGAADEAEAILHDNGTVVDISAYTWAAITTADGYYHLTLQSGISGTVGHVTIIVQDDSVSLPVKADFTVIEEAAYDFLLASGATPIADINAEVDTGISDAALATAAALSTAQADLDIITGADGVNLLTATQASIDAIEADTDVIDDGTSGLVKIATDVAAILVDTGTTLQSELDGIQADTEDIQTQIGTAGAGLTNITLANDLSATMKTSVQTAVDAAIDTAISELSVAAPTATPTLRTGLMLLYMALRNKLVVQTSGTDAIEIYNDAGTKIAAKTITDDGSDYTEAEMA